MKRTIRRLAVATAFAGIAFSTSAFAQDTLRVGLLNDPDLLDPAFGATTSGRMVLYNICDRLFEIDADGNIAPQLALSYEIVDDGLGVILKLRPGVTFHDGEVFDAEAVKYTFNRNMTLEGSGRRNELALIDTVQVIDPLTVKLVLKQPFTPLIDTLTDRSGVMVSPRAADELGERFGNAPVCSGPYKFVERVQQDKIVLKKFENYWNAENVHIENVIYRPVTDNSIRLTNLQAGALDMIVGINVSNLPQIEQNPSLKVTYTTDLGYQWIAFNVAKGEQAKGPLGTDARVRKAFELALDRSVINSVVFDGRFMTGNQWINPKNPFYQEQFPIPARDVEKAKALLAEAGVKTPLQVDFMVANDPELRQVVEIIQAMTAEAGFDVRIRPTEHATAISEAHQGRFEAYIASATGRLDPHGNVLYLHSQGKVANYGGYNNPDVDRMITEAASKTEFADRKAIYGKIAAIVMEEVPVIYLYHRLVIVAHSAALEGFVARPDGMLPLVGLHFKK